MKKGSWDYVWISVFQYLFSVLDLKLHTLVQSCMYLYEKIQQKIMKRIHITWLKNEALDVFVMSLTQSTNIIPRKWSFFPFVIRVQISSWQITICKSIYINCELAIPKILETVSGKNIFYQALNYLFCNFSFLTKICDTSIWQFIINLNSILVYSYDVYKPGKNGIYICTEAMWVLKRDFLKIWAKLQGSTHVKV